VKLFFLLIALLNISFFFWEYRKGAPEIYQPKTIHAKQLEQQIFLLSESLPAEYNIVQRPVKTASLVNDADKLPMTESLWRAGNLVTFDVTLETDLKNALARQFIPLPDTWHKLSDVLNVSAEIKPIDAVVSETKNTDSVQKNTLVSTDTKVTHRSTACYMLQSDDSQREMQTLVNNDDRYHLIFQKREQTSISSYLVLTDAADSLQAAKEQVKSIRQQGIEDLWLFRQGEFKWRISLGLFSSKAKAIKARKHYGKQITQTLNIVPRIRKQKMTLVTVVSQQGVMPDFERTFSTLITKKVNCTPDL